MSKHWQEDDGPNEEQLDSGPSDEELLYGSSAITAKPTKAQRLLKRVRNEFAFELLVVAVCIVLAVGLDFKIAMTVVLLCLKFAIPDFVTAFLVFRSEKERAHGFGLATLFIATGMARASVFAGCALLAVAIFVVPAIGQGGLGKALIPAMGAGLLCLFGFLAVVFPFAFLGYLVSVLTGTKMYFAKTLTELRRTADPKKRRQVALDVNNSLWGLGIGSGISLSVLLVSTLFFIPPNRVVGPEILLLIAGAFASPFLWAIVFVRGTLPQSEK